MRSLYQVEKIVKKHMDLSFREKDFVKIEILFRLCERIGVMKNVSKFYMLLSRGDIIYEKHFSNENYLLGNAKKLLTTLSHAKVYRDIVKEYCLKSNLEYCMYVIEDDSLKRNSNIPIIYADRLEDYDRLLDTEVIKETKLKKKTDSKSRYSARIETGKDVVIQFENIEAKNELIEKRVREIKNISISMEEILKAADRIDEKEGKEYRRRTLENNIYDTSQGRKEAVSEFHVNGVINMAGQVASGKSTFADALGVAMMDQGYRIVIILPTVDLVLKKEALFHKLGYETCVLIGNYGRSQHINNQMRGRYYLSEDASKILQQPCLLNAFIDNSDITIKYGKEPCINFKKLGNSNSKESFICQYYDFCPRTKNDRNIVKADIVITTLEGFCLCNFGAERKNFLEYAVENFDLVIIDEVDSAVCSMDAIFAPSLPVNEYLKKNFRAYRNKFKESDLDEKLKWGREEQEFVQKSDDFEDWMYKLSKDVKEHRTGWSEYDLKNFSAMSLLYKINPKIEESKCGVPEEIWDIFYDLLNPKHSRIQEEFLNIVESGKITISYMIEKLMEIAMQQNKEKEEEIQAKFENVDNKMWKKLLFILKVIAFEQLYRELSQLVEGLYDVPIELREILNRNLNIQQKIMPNAPLGNTLAIEVKDDEMYIKKQFSLGRALGLRMPYLKLDSNGNPIGANVLLMSGTGYMPGSDRYHISDKVDYVIEAEQIKRDYIAKTKVKSIRSTVNVSGANAENKNNNLRRLIEENERKIIKCVKRNEKILIIVNSYEQCKVAYGAIEKILNKNNLDYEVCYLKSDNGEITGQEDRNSIQRRDITKFDQSILIAPACVIERGYNIVDSLGNAWFDTVMFLVRPMVDPSDYKIHVQRVHGYIMNQFTERLYEDRIAVMEAIRKEAFKKYAKLEFTKGGLSDLPEDMQIDAIASLFVVIEQVFGRLCRIGTTLKNKYPTIYWVDGAFFAAEEGKFDTIKELEKYLDYLMNESSNPIVARTLYEPFYKALKGDK